MFRPIRAVEYIRSEIGTPKPFGYNVSNFFAVDEPAVVSQQTLDVARRAKLLYEGRLRAQLEVSHLNSFVAIEPDSGDCFLGNSLSDAIQTARQAHPDRLAFALRIGHATAIHIGVMSA